MNETTYSRYGCKADVNRRNLRENSFKRNKTIELNGYEPVSDRGMPEIKHYLDSGKKHYIGKVPGAGLEPARPKDTWPSTMPVYQISAPGQWVCFWLCKDSKRKIFFLCSSFFLCYLISGFLSLNKMVGISGGQ